MKQNIELLVAIRKKGLRQVDFARVVGDHHTFISRVINGWVNLDDARKERWARELDREPGELFGD